MMLAAASMKKAQDDDWDKDRQKSIDKNDKQNSQNADDDATEAAKDFPEPPGRSPFPPPPGGGRASNFIAYSPKIPADYREAQAALKYNASMIAQLSGSDSTAPVGSDEPEAEAPCIFKRGRAERAGDVDHRGIRSRMAIRRSPEISVVKRRTAAKVNMMHRAWNDKYQSIIKDAAAARGADRGGVLRSATRARTRSAFRSTVAR